MSSSFINIPHLPGSVHSANTSKKVTQQRPSPYLSIQHSNAMGSSWPPTQLHLRDIMTRTTTTTFQSWSVTLTSSTTIH
ncbi:hypothetical protein MCOR02_004147 [Pyricularia oryzae]|nr:hypothetical protein MCOR02_004147 [Pyricularia oryzae]